MTASSTTPDLRVSPGPIAGGAKLAEYARIKARRKRRERAIEGVLLLAACVSVRKLHSGTWLKKANDSFSST